MGCCYSRIEREEMVSRCKARKRYMKQLVRARQAFSAAHSMYLRSLRSTGSALLQFANAETCLHLHHHHHHRQYQPPQPPTPPPPPPPMSPSSDTWTSVTESPALPPPPPPPPSSGWDFWDPFVPSSSRAATEEEWDAATTTAASEVVVTATGAMSQTAPPSVVSGFSKDTATTSEMAMVVARNSKDLVEIVKELDEYFLKAGSAGGQVSVVLEIPTPSFSGQSSTGKVHSYGIGRGLSPMLWTWGSNSSKLDERMVGVGGCGMVGMAAPGEGLVCGSHCSTVERLYAWEKKLFLEVKNCEILKAEHEKRVAQLRKLEVKRGDYLKTEKTKKEVEKLESQMMVGSQAIESTSAEIIKLRETELYPQLLELVKGLMGMWRSMYECHQVQTHIVQQLKYLRTVPSTEPTSEIHRQSTLQLELEVQQWHLSFCNLVKAQQDYIQSLTGWLRLSLFQFNKNPLFKTGQESRIYSLSEEFHLAINRIPDKVASEGIKSFLTVIHAIVAQQAEEHKQKKKSETAFKELEKRTGELRLLEAKYGPYSAHESSGRKKDPVGEKRVKVEMLKAKAEEEKSRHEKSVNITRSMTLNNLQMGFPHVFEAIVGFSSVCMHAFESVYNQAKTNTQEHDLKMILT